MSHKDFVYLAGPIDQVTADEAKGWRIALAGRLNYRSFHTYDPAAAFNCAHVDHVTAALVDVVNREALRQCGILVAQILPGQIAFGTVREIEYAVMARKEVWLIAPHLRKSFSTYDLRLCNDVDDFMQRFGREHPIRIDGRMEAQAVTSINLDYSGHHTATPAVRQLTLAERLIEYHTIKRNQLRHFVETGAKQPTDVLGWLMDYEIANPEPEAGAA